MGPETCVICGMVIPVERRKKGGTTCGPDCHRERENQRRRKTSLAPTVESAPVELTDAALLEEASRRGFHIDIPVRDAENTVRIDTQRFATEPLRWGLVSDSHLCSKFQQLTHLKTFYRLCSEREIDTVLHTGDIVDGHDIYKGQEYETFLFGLDAQRDYACENYPEEPGVTTYFIEGNHDYGFYKKMGASIGAQIAGARSDLNCIGSMGAYIEFGPVTVYLLHPDKGGAYALSYNMQKIVENFTPENKPNIVVCGHWHRSCYVPGYRNVECIQLPAFQSQTPYLKRKGIQPVVAGAFVEVVPDEKGLASLRIEFVHFHEHIERDY